MVPAAAADRKVPEELVAGVSGAVVGLGAFALSVGGVAREYGAALLVGTPTIAGFIIGAILARLNPNARGGDVVLAALLGETIMVVAVIAFAIEGIFCIWLILPVFFIPTILGTLLGFYGCRRMPGRRADAAAAATLLSFFALLGLDHVAPLPSLGTTLVETTVDVDAPPDRVWAEIPSVATMPPPEAWGFAVGIAYPVRATMRGEGVGATRTCEFSTGPATETIDLWEPGRALGFTIDEQPEPMRELTLYRTVRQPHNDGYVKSLRGEFRLEPRPGGGTRLTGRSWYTLRLAPETYWTAWCDVFVHQIHRRVLDVVKARAEGPPGARLVLR